MNDMRKITVEVPAELLEKAQEQTGHGVSETVREGLELLRRRSAFQRLRELRGKVKFDIDLMALRKEED